MNAAAMVSFRSPVLPWATSAEDDALFNRITRRVLIAALLLSLLMLFMPAPQVDRTQPQEVSPRLAKLVLEREAPLPVPPAPPSPPPKLEAIQPAQPQAPAVKPEPARATQPPPKVEAVKGAPVPEARNPQPNKPAGEIDAARRKVASIGLLEAKDALAELRGAPLAVQLKQDIRQGPGVGTGVGVGVGAGLEPGTPSRALITSNAAGGSGGINTASYSRDTGGGGLAGRATTLVEGVAGGGGGGGAGGGGSKASNGMGNGNGTGSGAGAGKGGTLQRGNGGKAARSIEEIKLVFERNKGAIYAIYNRALREDPSLQGKVVLELKISPSGAVDCRIVSSELHAPDLENKLLARIRQFDFGAKDVDQMIVNWPVDFLPS